MLQITYLKYQSTGYIGRKDMVGNKLIEMLLILFASTQMDCMVGARVQMPGTDPLLILWSQN